MSIHETEAAQKLEGPIYVKELLHTVAEPQCKLAVCIKGGWLV